MERRLHLWRGIWAANLRVSLSTASTSLSLSRSQMICTEALFSESPTKNEFKDQLTNIIRVLGRPSMQLWPKGPVHPEWSRLIGKFSMAMMTMAMVTHLSFISL